MSVKTMLKTLDKITDTGRRCRPGAAVHASYDGVRSEFAAKLKAARKLEELERLFDFVDLIVCFELFEYSGLCCMLVAALAAYARELALDIDAVDAAAHSPFCERYWLDVAGVPVWYI